MTIAALGWPTAGVCAAALIGLWFWVSGRELRAKRRSLDAIGKQVQLHRKLLLQERGTPYDASAQNVLSGKLIAYSEVEKEYNVMLKQPMHRLPALFLGFHPTGKGGN